MGITVIICITMVIITLIIGGTVVAVNKVIYNYEDLTEQVSSLSSEVYKLKRELKKYQANV